MANKSGLNSRLVNGKLGNWYTKIFLGSKQVKIVSEGDFLSRIRALCLATYLMPFQFIWICFFIYARVVVSISATNNTIVPESQIWMLNEQVFVLNFFIVIQVIHICMLAAVVIVMLNQTLGKGTMVFTAIFNILYISEALAFGSIIFVLDWIGFLQNFSDLTSFLTVLSTQWLWLVMIIGAMFAFKPVGKMWKEVNTWNREWIRIDHYRKTQDKENAFIFKTWVTPGEIRARREMIAAGWLAIFTASVFQILDVFTNFDFNTMKYVILIFGYIVFILAFVVPYNQFSLIFYWISSSFLFGLVIYALYAAQNFAWQANNWYAYLYLFLIIPWAVSLSAAIRYSWTIKDKEEIKAIVLNMFENKDEFETFLENREQQISIEQSEDTV